MLTFAKDRNNRAGEKIEGIIDGGRGGDMLERHPAKKQVDSESA